MDAHRTPDEQSTHQDNELICRLLLGWTRSGENWSYRDENGQWYTGTPSFTTWAEAGLILDALAARGISYDLSHTKTEDGLMRFGVVVWIPKRHTVDADALPVAIRVAALAYIKAVKS